jgi:hypothetical protein
MQRCGLAFCMVFPAVFIGFKNLLGAAFALKLR